MTKVIFDGECDFCSSCVAWVESRSEIEAIPNQSIDPFVYGLTRDEVTKSVVVIDEVTYISAKAVAYLLQKCGFKWSARILVKSGTIGEFGYQYVANHREGFLVKLLHKLIKRTTR